MTNQSILTEIALGVFFAELGIGYAVFQTEQPELVSQKQDPIVEGNLARFDELDFEAFSKQDWELFK